MSNHTNAFTVDVEDYFQVSGFERDIDRDDWDQYESRVVGNTTRILDLLDRRQIKGTFFVLGWVAKHYPKLVLDIDRRGHEIGSHSYWHRLAYEQTPEEFRADLVQSRDVLQQILGRSVTAYRSPSFSITKQSLWALDILADEGFEVDSSIFPIRHDRYGIPDAKPEIHQRETESGPLIEFPPSVVKWAGCNLPVSGGGYFRLYPLALTTRLLRRINDTEDRPFMFYIHPWEIDPDQPRLRVGSLTGRFRHYVNLTRNERKLERLLKSFRFGRLCDSVSDFFEKTSVERPTIR